MVELQGYTGYVINKKISTYFYDWSIKKYWEDTSYILTYVNGSFLCPSLQFDLKYYIKYPAVFILKEKKYTYTIKITSKILVEDMYTVFFTADEIQNNSIKKLYHS